MKRIITGLLSAVMVLSAFSCSEKKEDGKPKAQDLSKAAPVREIESNFGKYVSNTYVATGNNHIVESADGVTYRAYFPAS